MIDNLPSERADRESFPTPTTSGGSVRFSMGANDFMAQDRGNESMWFLLVISFK